LFLPGKVGDTKHTLNLSHAQRCCRG